MHVCNMMQYAASQRTYLGVPCRTRAITTTIRVDLNKPAKRQCHEVPRQRGKHQAAGTVVYIWAPRDTDCKCKRKCAEHLKPESECVALARAPLYDTHLTKPMLNARLAANWRQLLLLPDGRCCCKDMALRILGVSSHRIYGDQRRVPRPLVGRQSVVAVSIGSWFEKLKVHRVFVFFFFFFCF
jgi:hypothetical protein